MARALIIVDVQADLCERALEELRVAGVTVR